jgi:hypothetical protein
MLEPVILATHSLAVVAALGGGIGYFGFNRWTDLKGARLWAVAVASALLFVLVFHPSGQSLDEARTWLLPTGG